MIYLYLNNCKVNKLLTKIFKTYLKNIVANPFKINKEN